MIKKVLLIVLSLVVLPLAFSACGVPQKKYDDLSAQLASMQQEYDAVKSELAAVKKERDTIRSERDALNSNLTSAQNEVKKLQGDLSTQSAALTQARGTNDTLQKKTSELETRLNSILDTKVMQYLRFSHLSYSYQWTLPISLGTYFYYKDRPRPAFADYGLMATDTYADSSVINLLMRNFKDAIISNNLKSVDFIHMVAAFTNTLPRTDNDIAIPYDEDPQYPIETLFNRGGDSTDTSILAAAILSREGYDVALLNFEKQKHMAVGVNIPGAAGSAWSYQGKKFFYLETAVKGWQLGECPPELRTVQPLIVALNK